MKLRPLILGLGAFASTICAAAPPEPFMPAQEAARLLADGKPWNGARSDGERVKLTLNPDGTGRFGGPTTRSITWTAAADTICINIGFPLGSRCLRFRRQNAGLQSFEGDAPGMILSR